MNTHRKIKDLKPGDPVKINDLETTFSHMSPEGHPVFEIKGENNYVGQYALKHLTESHYVNEIR